VEDVAPDSFMHVLLKKLITVFSKVSVLAGGFVDFQAMYPEFCENMMWKYPGLTALSQPCMATSNSGPTRILPFLYLGSEEDAHNKELLQSHNITYELNVSNKCPKPDFIPEGRFMRIPVNDSHNEKLLPYFPQAFQFVEKVRKSNECALVHCLAGISRSPTVAIAYVMRHLRMNCEDAYRYVKSKRASIAPNFNFLGQLLEYEQQLISENILENKFQSQVPSTSQPSTSEFLLGTQTLLPPMSSSFSTYSQRTSGKRLNLSLRLSPFPAPSSLGTLMDASPTTALSRLQLDIPQGKENRTGILKE
jgi:dual specificity MAP kinase phosphatase